MKKRLILLFALLLIVIFALNSVFTTSLLASEESIHRAYEGSAVQSGQRTINISQAIVKALFTAETQRTQRQRRAERKPLRSLSVLRSSAVNLSPSLPFHHYRDSSENDLMYVLLRL